MRTIGKYELLDLLGRGGCGDVWKARDTELGRVVALKLMQRTDAEDLARFKREAHVVAQLSHPNIAQLYEFSVEPPYLAMQYIEGGPISEAKEKIAALRDAGQAVHFAHQRGILHRDLKPANIMVDTAGRASVLDFGLAREVKGDQTAMTMSGDILGTPSFMAPEQARGDVKNLDVRTDVYGLGATLYFLLTGRPPHTGATAFDVISHVLKDEVSRPRGDRDLETICLKALEKEPARRYASAEEFADDLGLFLNKEPIRARPASTLYRLMKKIQKQPVVWSLGAMLVAAIFGGTAFGVTQVVRRWASEHEKLEDYRKREQARPHLDAGRAALMRLDTLLANPEWEREDFDRLTAEAGDELRQALAEYPNHPEAYLELARLSRELENPEEAIAYCTKAVAASEKFATAYLERALIRLERYEDMRHEVGGDVTAMTTEAESLLKEIRADLGRVRTWSKEKKELAYGDGIIAFADGDYVRAGEKLEDYARRGASDWRGWESAGHAWLHAKGEESKAVEALTRGLKYRSKDAGLYVLLGRAKGNLGDHRGAIENYSKAIELKPDYAEAYNNRGAIKCDHLGDAEGAILDFSTSIRLGPDHASARYNRGVAKRKLGDPRGAIEDYSKAIDLKPDFADAYVGRGNAKENLGDPRGAIEDYSKAIEIKPDGADVYFDRGIAKRKLGDPRGAIEDYSKAIEKRPDYAEAYVGRGAAKGNLGDWREAIEDHTKALAYKPDDALAYLNRGIAKGNLGDPRGEIEDYSKAIEIKPDYAEVYYNRGIAKRKLGDPRGAIEDFTKAIDLKPDYAEGYANRGLAKQDSGDLAGAAADLREALRVAPEQWSYRQAAEGWLRDVEAKLKADY